MEPENEVVPASRMKSLALSFEKKSLIGRVTALETDRGGNHLFVGMMNTYG